MQAQQGVGVGWRPPVGRHDVRLAAASTARAQRAAVNGSGAGFRMSLGLAGSDLMGIGPAPRRSRRPVSAAADGAPGLRVDDKETSTPAQSRPHTVGADPAQGRRLAGLVMQANAEKCASAADRPAGSRHMFSRQAAWASQLPDTAGLSSDAGQVAKRWMQGAKAVDDAGAGRTSRERPAATAVALRSKCSAGVRQQESGLPAARRASSATTSAARSTMRRALRTHSNTRLLGHTADARAADDVRRTSKAGIGGWRGGLCGLDLYGRAAAALLEADVLLVAAGAGMSADSGLAVYKDIASVPAWRKAGLTYSDLCDPCWLEDDPEIFYGFWGSCMNTYMETDPHEGYDIIRRWISEEFSAGAQDESGGTSAVARDGSIDGDSSSEQQKRTDGDDDEESDSQEEEEEEDANERAMVFTSNVDTAFTRAGFAEDGVNVYEIHGDILTWQCSKGVHCSSNTWQMPSTFRFEVTKKTMRARRTRSKPKSRTNNPAQQQPSPTWTDTEDEDSGEDEDMQQKKNQNGEHESQQVEHDEDQEEQGPNHPLCRHCNARARPNILMFDDGNWIANSEHRRAYNQWWKKHRKRMKDNKQLKFVVLEIGAGVRIPTVRENSEKLMKKLPMGQARLIRINPDFELADSSHGAVSTSIIPIKENALSALKKIDFAMKSIKPDWAAAAAAAAAATTTGSKKQVDTDARSGGGGRAKTPANLAWKRAEATLRKAALEKNRQAATSKPPPPFR